MTPTARPSDSPSPRALAAGGAITLGELGRAVGALRVIGDPSTAVAGLRQDSRRIEPGDLFAVRAGQKTSGWSHVADAAARGAVAVMIEGEPPAALPLPALVVSDASAAIARGSAVVYGDPTRALAAVGITGTNGKTTTAHLVARALEANGARPGIMGTVGHRFEDLALEASHTTPEADEIARVAAAMARRGASHLVMEVSSHALALGRVEAVHFRVAAFTNLTQDHLDFHGDMAAYGETKARLFLDLAPEIAVINVDDPFGRELARRVRTPVLTVSAQRGAEADVAPLALSLEPRRTVATLRTPAGEAKIDSRLLGAHNLSNMALALGVAAALGLDIAVAASALAEASVPGRLERCDGPGDEVMVVVDYAHTPDALDRALSTLALLRQGAASPLRLLCVFGCGGDRDPSKRAPMGRAVAKWADVAVVTTDNPRTEDPAGIVEDILPGLLGARAVVVDLDRRRAIVGAIGGARPGDVVLIAGKGHETYQIVGRETRHFDDREEARAALALRRQSREQG